LLRHKGYLINDFADIFDVDRDPVVIWFDHYGSQGIEGLKDFLLCGQPPKLDKSKKSLEDWLNNHP